MKLITILIAIFGFVSVGQADSLPEFRPALLGNHKRSLVNMIDTQSLVKRGQGDGLVLFSFFVSSQGYAGGAQTFRGTPQTDLLRREIVERVEQAQLEPAIYHHQPVNVYIVGAAVFAVRNGQPHLRIYLNQNEADLKSGRDFIAPQFALVPGNTKFRGIYYPPSSPGHAGVAALDLDVDTVGKVKGVKINYEYPAGFGFGGAAADPIRDALFVPGFRDGKIVSCHFTWPIIFRGPGKQMKSG